MRSAFGALEDMISLSRLHLAPRWCGSGMDKPEVNERGANPPSCAVDVRVASETIPACHASAKSPPAQGNRISTGKDFEQVTLVPGSLEALVLDAHFRCPLLLQEIHRDVP